MQCTSGTTATYDCSGSNEVGLVFDGTSRELRTCNFNLASGKCFGQDDTCTISQQPSPSATTNLATSQMMAFVTSVAAMQSSSANVMPSPTSTSATNSWYAVRTHLCIV